MNLRHTNENKSVIRLLFVFTTLVIVSLLGFAACTPSSSPPNGMSSQNSDTLVVTSDPTTQISPTLSHTPTLLPAQTAAPIDQVTSTDGFDGERAYQDVIYQVALGPRTPGSDGHAQIRAWIESELEKANWQVTVQDTVYMGQPVINISASRDQPSDAEKPWILLGAHYDTRFIADQDTDPAKRQDPVPGGNDGASGVAVLLELARTLPEELSSNVSLVFFDAEDNGNIPEWDWIYGSRAYAEALVEMPDAVVIVDMIGDADLNIYYEKNSDPAISAEIFSVAANLGYAEQFIPEPRYRILDDHLPFIEKKVRAVDLIDFDYPYWHTTSDTADKVAAGSLGAVGETLWHWLQGDLSSLTEGTP